MQESYILHRDPCNPGSQIVYSQCLGKNINVHMRMNTENVVNIQNVSCLLAKKIEIMKCSEKWMVLEKVY